MEHTVRIRRDTSIAVTLFPKAMIMLPHKPSAESLELFQEGIRYTNRMTKQYFRHAIRLFQSSINLDPDFAKPYAEIAICYMELYRLYERKKNLIEKAKEFAQSAINIAPNESAGYRAFASIHLQAGEPVKAEAMVTKSIELDPNDFHNYFQAGFIYGEMARHREAAKAYEKALVHKPGDLMSYSNLVLHYEHLGLKDKARKTAKDALPYFENYLHEHPGDESIRMWQISLLESAGQIIKSIEKAEEVLLYPGIDPGTLYNIACTFIRAGKYDRGLEILKNSFSSGFADNNLLLTDTDLDPIRELPEFAELIS